MVVHAKWMCRITIPASSMAVTTVTFSYRPFRADLASSLRPRAMFGCIRLLAEDRSRTYQALAHCPTRVEFPRRAGDTAHSTQAKSAAQLCFKQSTTFDLTFVNKRPKKESKKEQRTRYTCQGSEGGHLEHLECRGWYPSHSHKGSPFTAPQYSCCNAQNHRADGHKHAKRKRSARITDFSHR